jgi:Protein of unknown function (DUF2933)
MLPISRHPLWVAAAMTVVIVVFYLLREHWGHVAGYWSYLLLLACPMMHLFGHGGHSHDAGHGTTNRPAAKGE